MDYWQEIINSKNKDDMHKGLVNTLSEEDIQTILATADFFGASDNELRQMFFDLGIARYRVFDWLAMGVMSAEDNGRIGSEQALKVFVHSFLKTGGVVSKFIEDLRISDYDLDNSWLKINLQGGEK